MVVLNFYKVFYTVVLFFAKESCGAGKFIGETKKSASSEEVIEVGIKSTKKF